MKVLDQIEGKRCVFGFLLGLANSFWRARRRARFKSWPVEERRTRCVVAEGDSWFLHPLRRDILDHLSTRFPLVSLAAGGDDLLEYYLVGEYLTGVRQHRPRVVLLSGGGNDLLGGRFRLFLNHWTEDRDNRLGPARFLNHCFQDKLEDILTHYRRMIENINQASEPGQAPLIILQSYGYGPAGKFPGIWLGRHLRDKKIISTSDRDGVVREIIDSFHAGLTELAKGYGNVVVMDFRSLLDKRDDKGRKVLWGDEIHPNAEGFKEIAERYSRVIEDHLNQVRQAPISGKAPVVPISSSGLGTSGTL